MAEFHYQPLFELAADDTPYRKLTSDGVSTFTPDGREMLSRVRRSVLETGGHRHVGFTAEYRIPTNLARPE